MPQDARGRRGTDFAQSDAPRRPLDARRGLPNQVAAASLQLTRQKLADPDTLVLCVVEDTGSTVRGSAALGEIGRVNGLPERTIVVLTKVDMSPRKNPARLASRLADPVATVGFQPLAFVPVINRDEGDGKSLSDAVEAEEATFAEWSQTTPGLLAAGRLGLALCENQH